MYLVAETPERLDRFLARTLPEHSRSKLKRMIENGDVRVDGRIEKVSFFLRSGANIELPQPPASQPHNLTPADIPLEIVFEDEMMLVVNKPRGLASHPAASLTGATLVNALLGRHHQLSSSAGPFRPGIVHRLDKDTSGLMIVAKTDEAHVYLARQIEQRATQRRYFVGVSGNAPSDRFVVDAPIGRCPATRTKMCVRSDGKSALSRFKKIASTDSGSVLVAKLETGRTHQIRVHLSATGMPVLGDGLYAPQSNYSGPLQLHAAYLSFVHPGSGKQMQFFCLPDQQFEGRPLLSPDQLDPF